MKKAFFAITFFIVFGSISAIAETGIINFYDGKIEHNIEFSYQTPKDVVLAYKNFKLEQFKNGKQCFIEDLGYVSRPKDETLRIIFRCEQRPK